MTGSNYVLRRKFFAVVSEIFPKMQESWKFIWDLYPEIRLLKKMCYSYIKVTLSFCRVSFFFFSTFQVVGVPFVSEFMYF